MSRRPHTQFVKHFAAMHLILSMQDGDGSTPNVKYVRDNPTPPKVADWGKDTTAKYERFKYLQDFLPLVDPAVYAAFHKMLTVPASVAGLTLNEATVTQGTNFHAATLQRTTDAAMMSFWTGDPPHGCYWILREAVAEMLA